MSDVEEAFELSPHDFKSKFHMTKPMPDDSNFVFSCQSGRRSLTAGDYLKKFGYYK